MGRSQYQMSRDEIVALAAQGVTVRNVFHSQPCPRCNQIDLSSPLHTCHDLRPKTQAVTLPPETCYDTTGNRVARWAWRGGPTGDVEPY